MVSSQVCTLYIPNMRIEENNRLEQQALQSSDSCSNAKGSRLDYCSKDRPLDLSDGFMISPLSPSESQMRNGTIS